MYGPDDIRRMLDLVEKKSVELGKQAVAAARARLEFRALVRAGKAAKVKRREWGRAWTSREIDTITRMRNDGHPWHVIGEFFNAPPDSVRRTWLKRK